MYDIIIVGGGHAGVEAANIASQFKNLKIAIISMPNIGLASAPCNPCIGGVGKGQVVKELDALGGIIGKLADLSGIQYRILNESKGYAVQSTRVQIDKVKYSQNAEKLIDSIENIEVIRAKIEKIKDIDTGYSVSDESSTWNTKKIIFTVGTFLNGQMHTGSTTTSGGREGCESSDSLAEFFSSTKTLSARFKTGTPARLHKDHIDYSSMEEQASDPEVSNFHVLHGTYGRVLEQKSCYLAYTNERTMNLIRDNREKSPMFNGQISGVGARYCPSIEDKAYRYPDKHVHHVFIEPESLELDTVYPSGIATSLPTDIQKEMLETITGLENCKIEVDGYAVEYDVIDTTQLSNTLEMHEKPGLYFAGQVNGTSGYEEAAAQGFIAGINAALALNERDAFILSRHESYIGVMIEDLISNVRDEPYRLFTARSENRLFIREDNSVIRMGDYRLSLGFESELDTYTKKFLKSYHVYMDILSSTYINPDDDFLTEYDIKVPRRTALSEIIKQSSIDPVETLEQYADFCGLILDSRLIRTLSIGIKYEGYINKASDHYKKVGKLDGQKLDWKRITKSENISFECKQRVGKIKPETFGQLKLIEGIRPATLAVVAGNAY